MNVRRFRCRVALIGCGRWGRHILRDLVSLGCEVIVADLAADGRRRGVEGGAAQVVERLDELPAVAGAVVATPTTGHASVIEALLPRRIPIFCEKPLTAEPASAARLGEAATELFVMDKWRYHPGVEMLRDIARSGELGPVLGLRTARLGAASQHHDVDAIWILAPHDLSIGLEIFGYLPPPRTALAERFDGCLTGLVGVLGDDPWMMLEVSSLRSERRREIQLHCQEGTAVLPDAYSDHVQVFGPANSQRSAALRRRPISTEFPLLRELTAFVERLGGGPRPRSSAAEAALVVKTLAELRQLAGIGADRSS